MRKPTCDCIKNETDDKPLLYLWNSVNVGEVKCEYGTKMVYLPVNHCPKCGKPYQEAE